MHILLRLQKPYDRNTKWEWAFLQEALNNQKTATRMNQVAVFWLQLVERELVTLQIQSG